MHIPRFCCQRVHLTKMHNFVRVHTYDELVLGMRRGYKNGNVVMWSLNTLDWKWQLSVRTPKILLGIGFHFRCNCTVCDDNKKIREMRVRSVMRKYFGRGKIMPIFCTRRLNPRNRPGSCVRLNPRNRSDSIRRKSQWKHILQRYLSKSALLC